MIKILIVDDHELMRVGLKEILLEEKEMKIIGEAKNGDEMFAFLDHNECDIILLDHNMPDKKGTDLIVELKKRRFKAKVILLTLNSDYRKSIEAYIAGAAGFLNKSIEVRELINSIHTVYNKGRYINQEFAEKLAFNSLDEMKANNSTLTNPEFELATLLNKGYDLNEVSKELGLSFSSALQIKKIVFKKLKVENVIQLVHYFNEKQTELNYQVFM